MAEDFYGAAEPTGGDVLARLRRVSTAVARRIETELAPDRLTIGECDVLQILHRSKGRIVTAAALSSELLLSPAALTHRLDRLVEAGLVQRGRQYADRRNVSVHLTAVGRSRTETAAIRRAAAEQDVLKSLSGEELRHLDDCLRRLDPRGPGREA